ncbi:DUF488 domain-containing protein [Flavobacterium filum]|uniref:DUF488 domain-containing protein n=1 Tax=Flavobacterium filum TaxID=370974 RepID=UPI001D55B08F|nr:DUF488 domain-containing protein [Flavobacterium filum]MBV6454422.1 hypothetical protein [Bacteroidia bacterium]MBX3107396.1 DUF488 domain-containing protein [Bacteroidota bacterium]MCB0750795.1 DUF488 domain-containing protein [Ignavibacteriota bacterium]
MSKLKLYTLGYTLFQNGNMIDIEKMLNTLKDFKVSHLVDVRSVPYSKQFPQCNADNLKLASKHFSISYGHMPELGAKASPMQDVFSKASDIFFEDIFPISKSNRPEKTELFDYEEIVDFQKFRNDEYFSEGIKRIEKAYENEYTVALMCSEKRPVDCHRFFFVSQKIEEKFGDWIEVLHITKNKNGEIETVSNENINTELSEVIFNKTEIKKLDVLNSSMFESAKIENYFGNTLQDKKNDFCDRYWNLLHGWKLNKNNNNFNEYD